MDWKSVRKQFPAVEGQTFLNTATYGPGPRSALDAVHAANELWATARGKWADWESDGERARELFAGILGTTANCISLQAAASTGAGLVAENLPYDDGANIVVGDLEFRSNFYPWMAQERRGFQVRVVPARDGRLEIADLLAAIDGSTSLVAVSSVQSVNGFRIDLEQLGEACQKRNVRLFVDGTQSVGVLPIPLDLVDYVGVAGYKWLLAPRGPAYLYVRPELIEDMSPIAGNWKTPEQPYGDYYGLPYDPSTTARRFDISLAWTVWVGARHGLEFVSELGVERIRERNLDLARIFRERLRSIGLEASFDERDSAHIVALRIPDPKAVEAALAEHEVVAAVRGEFLRVSFHFFNDESDIEQAITALRLST